MQGNDQSSWQAGPPGGGPPEYNTPIDYGTPTGYGGPPANPQVRLEAIGEAWRLLTQQLGVWIGAFFIYMIVVGGFVVAAMFALGFGSLLTRPQPGAIPMDSLPPGFIPKYILMVITIAVIASYFIGGMFHMAVKQVKGETISISDITGAGEVTLSLIGASIVGGIVIYIGTLLCIIPGLIFNALLMLVFPLIVDRKIGAMAAIGQSWGALKGQLGMSLLLLIVLFVIYLVSAIPCGIGVILSFPLAILTLAVVYRDIFLGPINPGPVVPTGFQPPIPEVDGR